MYLSILLSHIACAPCAPFFFFLFKRIYLRASIEHNDGDRAERMSRLLSQAAQ